MYQLRWLITLIKIGTILINLITKINQSKRKNCFRDVIEWANDKLAIYNFFFLKTVFFFIGAYILWWGYIAWIALVQPYKCLVDIGVFLIERLITVRCSICFCWSSQRKSERNKKKSDKMLLVDFPSISCSFITLYLSAPALSFINNQRCFFSYSIHSKLNSKISWRFQVSRNNWSIIMETIKRLKTNPIENQKPSKTAAQSKFIIPVTKKKSNRKQNFKSSNLTNHLKQL